MTWARRLPPAVQLGIAAALLVGVFPSAFHVSVTGPNGQAEVAPGVNQANLGQLNPAGSGTVGGGATGGDGSALPTPTLTPGPNGSAPPGGSGPPQSHHCFGNPPRQTEDPLSPPCVASYSGSSAGATATGVTGSTIKVLLRSESSANGSNYTQVGVGSSDTPYVRTAKMLVRYFNAAFETYGRKVELIGQAAPNSNTGVADAADAAQQQAFAAINLGDDNAGDVPQYEAGLAQKGVVGFWTWPMVAFDHASLQRSFLSQHAPYVYSFEPDLEANQTAAANWICAQLAGGDAVHAGEASLIGTKRKFGLVYDKAATHPEWGIASPILKSDLQQTCGITFDQGSYLGVPNDPASEQAAVAQLQQDGVTTVIDMQSNATTGILLMSGADGLAPRYAPEWIVNWENPASSAFNARGYPQDQMNGVMAVNWQWRVGAPPSPYWYQAYSSVNADGLFDTGYGPQIYEALMMLFSGIQTAGPHLDALSMQQGLTSYRRTATDPYSPSAYFLPGDGAFIRDYTYEWWNTAAVPPGASPDGSESGGNGCYELVAGGLRFGPDQWPGGDHARDPGACGADWEKLGDVATDQANPG